MRLANRRFSTLTLLFAAWIFIGLLGGLETLMIHIYRPEIVQTNKIYWLPLMRVISGLAAISLVLYPGYQWLKRKELLFRVIGFILLMVLFSFVFLAFYVGQFQFAFLNPNMELFFSGIIETMMTDLHHIASYYFFLLFICAGKDYFDDRTAAIIKKEQVENELSKTKLEVLQRQIQPHFLFNTLNNTVAIIEEHKEAAQEMLVDLSELLRLSMEMDFGQMILLEKELEILSLYTSIEQKRFEHQLNFNYNIEDEVTDKHIPPFLLQPLVENAIKHGFKEGIRKLTIELKAFTDDELLCIEIKNDGSRLQPSLNGIGLQNVKDRLRNAYGNEVNFSLEQQQEWVVNQLKLPLT